MTRNQLHNLLVAAFIAGVEKCMEPIPENIERAVKNGHIGIVQAHMSGAAAKYAETVCLNPATAAAIKD